MNVLAFAESIQLIPDGTLIIHIGIIILMIFVLNHLLFKPVLSLLAEREKQTAGKANEAHGILKKVNEELDRYENSLRAIRAEGYSVLEQAQNQAAKEREKQVGQVRVELEQMLENQRQEIRLQTVQAKSNLELEARQMAATVGSQILGRPL